MLPFTDMSPARDQDYLCEGLAEELIDALTHVEGLRVAARTSSFQFRGDHDLREVGRKLNVGSLLEGSVRKAGDRLRVTVQLIDVATGFHKWSEKFERDAGDVFAMQDEIAEKVATLLRGGELSMRERRAVRRQPTAIETYECFLRGRQRMHTMQQPHMDEARALYQRAIALDAEYAPAWAGLATLHALLYEWWGSKAEDLAEADRASRIAMELAPDLADAHLRAATRCRTSAATRKRSTHFEAAARINPNLFDAYYYYGRAAFAAGDIEKSDRTVAQGRRSAARGFREPAAAGAVVAEVGPHGRSARDQSRGRAPRRTPARGQPGEWPRVVFRCGRAAIWTGSWNAHIEWARRAEQLYPDDMGVIINGACLRARNGMKEEALDLLERVFNKGWGKKDWVENDPDYDSLRAEPRFIAMMAKLK